MIRTLCVFLSLLSFTAVAEEWFVAVDGRDSSVGSIDSPFSSIARAQESASPGDIVYIRGGTYKITDADVARKKKIWAYVILLSKSGLPGKRITYAAFRDEKPVFDFSAVAPENMRVHAFEVTGSWIHLKGLEVTGVQVTAKNHTQSICFSNNGSNNIYEQLCMHDGQAIGIYTVRGSNNLFLNCDAYNNHDYTSEDGLGGNTDGFGAHPKPGCKNNVFRGCRSWFNSDDGFDCINAQESVVFDNCWAFFNGYSPEFKPLKDGNGFKAGGYGVSADWNVPDPVPRHKVSFCVAARNRAYGFYSNHHVGGSDWINNSAYLNRSNYNMLSRLYDERKDVPGYEHKLYNNLGFKSKQHSEIIQLDRTRCDLKNNSFDGACKINENDFISLDDKQLMRPRKKDGSLPEIDFLIPKKDSLLSGMGAFASRE